MTLVLVGLKAVCYLNSYGKEFKGGLFRFQIGEPATVAPSAGVSMSFSVGSTVMTQIFKILS